MRVASTRTRRWGRTLLSALCFGLVAAATIGGHPARAQDAAEFVVRLNRIEGQMRQLSGQVEQLQFENKQLKEQLRKFQEDVEFRFQERGGKSSPPAARQEKPARRSDAFDPGGDPAAPGAPRQLGSSNAPAAPRDGIASLIEDDEDRPAGGRPVDLAPSRTGTTGLPTGPVAGLNPAAGVSPGGAGDARSEYDAAYAYLSQRRHDRAEAGFRNFIEAHPRDRLVPDAVYWLGETYLQRNRHREAAEQFLKVSTHYAKSSKAPEAMLKLGVSLGALGAKDQACATFAEFERKYPSASASVKQSVDREQKRARCAT